MHPKGSVTRCLVCLTVADGLGPGSLSACLLHNREDSNAPYLKAALRTTLWENALWHTFCLLNLSSSERTFISCGWELFPVWKAEGEHLVFVVWLTAAWDPTAKPWVKLHLAYSTCRWERVWCKSQRGLYIGSQEPSVQAETWWRFHTKEGKCFCKASTQRKHNTPETLSLSWQGLTHHPHENLSITWLLEIYWL